MNEKEQQLSFEKGITNVPSDALCSDNALADSRDLVYDNGEHKVIQRPVVHMDNFTGCHEMPKFLYVHKTTKDIYIGYFNSSKRITFGEKEGSLYVHLGSFIDIKYSSATQISSIGKTVIISDEDGLKYVKWDGVNSYEILSSTFPEIQFEAYLYPMSPYSYFGSVVTNTGKCDDIISGDDKILDQEGYNNLVTGLYAKNLKQISQKKGFAEPFFTRIALEMYDGSYTLISNPMLFFPTVNMNSVGDWSVEAVNKWTLSTYFNFMFIKQSADYSSYSDLIKNVVIFMSDGINIYDISVDQPFKHYETNDVVFNGICRTSTDERSKYREVKAPGNRSYSCLKMKDNIEIANNIKSTSRFYKVCEIGLEPTNGYINIAEKIETHTLENITSLEQLKDDDYYSRCTLYPATIYTYNSRLILANISRGFFDGFDFFLSWDNETSSEYDCYVTIKTESGKDEVVWHHINETYQKQGYYFYYPDSRATNVVIYQGANKILDTKLTEHPGLNGAYYFAGLPIDNPELDKSKNGKTNYNNGALEQLPNYIVTSEVNNPWLFKAEGYNKVGTGKILGMSTITQALSQGQFGQFPLLVFSESGIWAMSLDNTGLFVSIHPMSREVCNNPKSITQTDGAVFFTSEKGLMVVAGSDVGCVSEQLSGKIDTFPSEYIGLAKYDFKTFLSKGCIAYDYRDSLLWILGGNASYSYIYSIKSGTFSMCSISPNTRIINNYPDTLIQLSDNTVVSLLERVDINKDEGEYGGTIVTRPMKFENALALKSLLQVRHITDMHGTLKLRIFASNNFKKWVELHSLGGMPWKYYRFAYTFEGLKATDRFAGSVVVTQERRTDKIR